jgi:2-amino-4-hydroxy-6-hydroxymethyldihydropteridine diphosphokinase
MSLDSSNPIGRAAAQGQEPWVVVALGSNLGDSVRVFDQAARALEAFAEGPVRRSRIFKSTPVDCPPGSPLFVNAVVAFQPRSGLTPETLLKSTQALEREGGRLPKRVLNEPRPLDLDLIAWGTERRDSAELILPHPRAHLRRFVMEPLADLLPDWEMPGTGKTVKEVVGTLPTDPLFEPLDSSSKPEIPWLVALPQ